MNHKTPYAHVSGGSRGTCLPPTTRALRHQSHQPRTKHQHTYAHLGVANEAARLYMLPTGLKLRFYKDNKLRPVGWAANGRWRGKDGGADQALSMVVSWAMATPGPGAAAEKSRPESHAQGRISQATGDDLVTRMRGVAASWGWNVFLGGGQPVHMPHPHPSPQSALLPVWTTQHRSPPPTSPNDPSYPKS
eukprot:352526-Chlamydomonas_euryale.AAC.10